MGHRLSCRSRLLRAYYDALVAAGAANTNFDGSQYTFEHCLQECYLHLCCTNIYCTNMGIAPHIHLKSQQVRAGVRG